jgi:hypothetical protein
VAAKESAFKGNEEDRRWCSLPMRIRRKIEGTKKIPDGAKTVSFVDD